MSELDGAATRRRARSDRPARRRVRGGAVRPGAGRYRGVLRGLRVRARGIGQRDRRGRQVGATDVCRLPRPGEHPSRCERPRPAATGGEEGVVRLRRRDDRAHRHAHRRCHPVRARRPVADLDRRPDHGTRPGDRRRRLRDRKLLVPPAALAALTAPKSSPTSPNPSTPPDPTSITRVRSTSCADPPCARQPNSSRCLDTTLRDRRPSEQNVAITLARHQRTKQQ